MSRARERMQRRVPTLRTAEGERLDGALGAARAGELVRAPGTSVAHSFTGVAARPHARDAHGEGQAADVHTESGLASCIREQSGGGLGLGPEVRDRLSEQLGAPLSDVRLHTGSEADSLARALDADAFTSGRDIFFRDGAYDPATPEGQRLLAHEAAHVVQQETGPVAGTPTADGLLLSEPADQFELAADRAAESVVAGRRAAMAPSPAPASVTHGATAGRVAVQRTPHGTAAPAPSQTVSFSDKEAGVVSAHTASTEGSSTSTDEIDRTFDELIAATQLLWGNYQRGLDNFATYMLLSSEEEAAPQYLEVAVKTAGKFVMKKLIDDMKGTMPYTSVALSLIMEEAEELSKEHERAQEAGGQVTTRNFLVRLRTSIGDREDEALASINTERRNFLRGYSLLSASQDTAHSGEPVPRGDTTGMVIGVAALALSRLRDEVARFKRKVQTEATASRYQQEMSEQFADTGELTGDLRQSGVLRLSMHVVKNDDGWTTQKLDGHWTLPTTAPHPDRVAGSLRDSLRDQGKTPAQSGLPKMVDLTVEVERFGLNQYEHGGIYWKGSDPQQFETRTEGDPKLFADAWSQPRFRAAVLAVTELKASSSK